MAERRLRGRYSYTPAPSPPVDAAQRRDFGLMATLAAADDPSEHRHASGALMRLADFECEHGRLPGDRLDARCVCWSGSVEEQERRDAESGEAAA